MLILLISVPLMGQNPVHTTGKGKFITTGRGYYQTQSLYIAPEEEEGSFVTVWEDDFEEWTVEDTISEATIQSHWGSGADLQSELPSDPEADDASIVTFDGSKTMRSRFLEGQCCVEIQDYLGTDGGSGLHVEVTLDDHYPHLYLSWNLYLQSDFDNSDGMKMLGFRMDGDGTPTARNMIVTSNTYSLDRAFQFYPSYYYDADMTDYEYNVTTVNHEIERGAWHNLTIRVYTGTTDTNDGFMEFFYDGVFVSRKPNMCFKSSQDNNTDIGTFSWSTFMGGNQPEWFDSPQTQYHYIDDVVIWYDENETASQTSGEGRTLTFPSAANWPR